MKYLLFISMAFSVHSAFATSYLKEALSVAVEESEVQLSQINVDVESLEEQASFEGEPTTVLSHNNNYVLDVTDALLKSVAKSSNEKLIKAK